MSESKDELVGLAVKEELLTRSFKDSVMENKGLVIGVAVAVGVVGLAVGAGCLACYFSEKQEDKKDENSTTAVESTDEGCPICMKIRTFFEMEEVGKHFNKFMH